MAAPTTLTLAEAALVLGTTKKALERRAERGTLRVHRAGGVRMVDAGELLRAGLARLAPAGPAAPAGAATGALMHRLEEAEADREALRAALAATESALRRARGDARELRQRLEATSVPAPAGADPVAPPAPMPEAVSAGAPDEPATRGTGWLRRRRAPALTG